MGRGADDERWVGTAGAVRVLPDVVMADVGGAARDLEALSPGELVAELVASRLAENLEQSRRLRVVAAMWRAYRPSEAERREDRRLGRRHTSGESVHEAGVVTEVAGTMGWTRAAAARRVDAAVALLVDRRLRRAALLAAAGVLDWARLDALVERTASLTPEQARSVESRVLVRGTIRLTVGRFRLAVDRAVLAVDPDGAQERRKGVREARRVSFWKAQNLDGGSDGAAVLCASGPADALAVAMACLDAAARHLRKGGDDRTLDQLRHDLLVTGCTTGALPVPHDVLPPVPGAASVTATAGAAGSRSDGAPDVVCVQPRPAVPAHITVTMSLQTLLGLNDEPADLAGFGPIAAEMARDLARDGVWRCAAVDDTHGTVLGVGRRTWTPGYVPGAALRQFLAVAAPTCSVPWCEVGAESCDLDHRKPYAAGGPTCVCGVGPLCRRHHREKSSGHLTGDASTDPAHPLGTVVWTTRAGQRFVVLPYAPLPPEAYVARAERLLAAASTVPSPAASTVPQPVDAATPPIASGPPSEPPSDQPDDPPPF